MKKNIFFIGYCLVVTLYSHAQIVCDDFNIANTSVIPGWTEQQGDWTIDNNRLRTPGNTAWQFITMDGSTLTDGCVTARAIYGSPAQVKFVGVVGRYVSNMSYVMLKIQDNGSVGYWDMCYITYNDNNVHNFSGNFGTDAIIQIEFSGTTLTARVDVNQNGVWDYVETVTVASSSTGLSGIGAYANAFADDFCYGTACCDFPGVAGAITGSSSACQDETAVSYGVPVINNADSYVWEYSGTGAVINGTTENINIDFSDVATSGNLTVYAMNICGTGLISANFPITVNPLPDAADAIIGDDVVCNETTDNQYSVSVLSNTDTYVWGYSGTGVTVNGTGNSITLDFSVSATSGVLSVYGENTCGSGLNSTFNITVNDCTGMNEMSGDYFFEIIPNPGDGNFRLEFSLPNSSLIDVKILNIMGQVVYTLEGVESDLINYITFHLDYLSQGNYTIIITHPNGISKKQFIINK